MANSQLGLCCTCRYISYQVNITTSVGGKKTHSYINTYTLIDQWPVPSLFFPNVGPINQDEAELRHLCHELNIEKIHVVFICSLRCIILYFRTPTFQCFSFSLSPALMRSSLRRWGTKPSSVTISVKNAWMRCVEAKTCHLQHKLQAGWWYPRPFALGIITLPAAYIMVAGTGIN